MKELIEYIGENNGWQSLAIIFVLFITGFSSFIKGWDFILARFEIETKGSKRRKEQVKKCAVQEAAIKALENKITEYDKINHDHWQVSIDYREKYAYDQNAIMEQLSSLTNLINSLQKKIDENELRKQVDGLRTTIISFATSLGNPQFRPSLDHYNNIFAKIEEYEEVLEKNGLENGQTTVSVKIIKRHYEQALERGDFLVRADDIN